jgi:chemotaxis protein MotB
LGVVLAIGVAIATAAGCGQQQLEERNVALTRQLQDAQNLNADLQQQNDSLKAQNQALEADLAQAKAAKPGAAPVRPARAKPEFGEGVETAIVGQELTVTLPETILFESGKANLKVASKRVLEKIVAVLNKDYPSDKIRVEGHTDNVPISKSKKDWQDNWDLSCNRSMAVTRFLAQKGVDPKRLSAAGYSFYKPVASNDTAAGRAKNRRVVIVVYP